MLKYAKPLALKIHFSNRYVYAQVVHVPTSTTICATSTSEKASKSQLPRTSTVEAAAWVGSELATRLKSQQVHAVAYVMENHQRYHGKLKHLLDSLTKGGVKLL